MARPGESAEYKQAKLLSSESKHGFRVWLNPKLVQFEKTFSWKKEGKEKAWEDALAYVDANGMHKGK